MRYSLCCFFLTISIPMAAQSRDALYSQACGPKDTQFVVTQVKDAPPVTPEAGKATVYIIQRESGMRFTTRVGLDGGWAGAILGASYIPLSVTAGEHHLCATTQDRNKPVPELLDINVEAGKVYYYLVRGSVVDNGKSGDLTMALGPLDSDEARYLLAVDPRSIATSKP